MSSGFADQMLGSGDVSSSNDATPTDNHFRSMRILAIQARDQRVGGAYFSGHEPENIVLLEEHEDINMQSVEQVIDQLLPSVIKHPVCLDPKFTNALEAKLDTMSAEICPEVVRTLTAEFKPAKFMHAFSSLVEEGSPISNLTLGSASAITSHLKDLGVPTQFKSSSIMSFTNHMRISRDSLLALQILNDPVHPNMHMRKVDGSLSLFSNPPRGRPFHPPANGPYVALLNRTKSTLGRKRLHQWMLQPLCKLPEISDRHDAVKSLIDLAQKRGGFGELYCQLSKVKNIKNILCGIAGHATLPDFVALRDFMVAALEIQTFLAPTNISLLRRLRKMNRGLISSLLGSISTMIDFEQSKYHGRVVIQAGVNPQLDERRRLYNSLPDYLGQAVEALAEKIDSPNVGAINIIYFPQLGFLMTVSLNGKSPAELELDEDFKLQFITEKVAYYKDPLTLELDEKIGDVYAHAVDLEVEILQILKEQLLEHHPLLESLADELSTLDCLVSFADFSVDNRLTRPTLTEEPILDIKNGRHILQEKCCDNIVPNDCRLGGPQSHKVMILTGPNSSGKSIFMKQCAIIVYLAQIGCFIPAQEKSVIGVVDKIFTRIQTRESSTKKLSAFQIDLRQVKGALAGYTPRSLLLIDEFGKGTLTEDGIALFGGLLEFLAESEASPRAIAITHFHELHQLNLLSPSLPIQWCTMDVLEDTLDSEDDPKVTFLYRVMPGKAQSSLGLACARSAGTPAAIINRAAKLRELYSKFTPPASIHYERVDPVVEQQCRAFLKCLIDGPLDAAHLEELRLAASNLHK